MEIDFIIWLKHYKAMWIYVNVLGVFVYKQLLIAFGIFVRSHFLFTNATVSVQILCVVLK